jgi:starch phosphorylase
VRFSALGIETRDSQHFFQVEVLPGNLNPDQLQVELYADSVLGGKPALEVMTVTESSADSHGVLTYSTQLSATRPASDYTARIIPHHPNASVPLEARQILWQR